MIRYGQTVVFEFEVCFRWNSYIAIAYCIIERFSCFVLLCIRIIYIYDDHYIHYCTDVLLPAYMWRLPWIFPGALLKINGGPGNIQGNICDAHHIHYYTDVLFPAYLSRLPWTYPGAPLKLNGAPGNIQGNLTSMFLSYICCLFIESATINKSYLILYLMLSSQTGLVFNDKIGQCDWPYNTAPPCGTLTS